MGKPVTSNIKRLEIQPINTKVNKEVFHNFRDYCGMYGYPMNVLIETFMQQYVNGRFDLEKDEILKWKSDDSEVDTLNTTFNKEIYLSFKSSCKENGFFVKHVITAFMEKFLNKKFILEYVEVDED